MLSLTATDLGRFMTCNGSRLLGKIHPVSRDRTDADEGDAVHWLIEQVFRGNFHSEELIDRKAENGVFITSDMVGYCEEYLADILGKGDVEVTTTFAKPPVYEIRGRSDRIYSEPQTLYVDDFKYGWKIVEPEMNWTLISHAIGFIQRYATQPQEIVFTIYQPRPFHPAGSKRSWRITYTELMQYWQELDAVLSNPTDKLVTSPHCYKCPSMSQCPAAQIATMNSIDTAQMAYDSEVDNNQLSHIMDELKRAKTLIEQAEGAYKDLATIRIRKGDVVPDYCLEISLGNSAWKDGLTSGVVQAITGVDVSKKQLMSPNQAKKAGVTEETIKSLCERKNKGIKLVRKDANKKAEQLFGKK